MHGEDRPPEASPQVAVDLAGARIIPFPSRPGPPCDVWDELGAIGDQLLDDLAFSTCAPKEGHAELLKSIDRAFTLLRPTEGKEWLLTDPRARTVSVLLIGIMTALCRLEGPTRLRGGAN